MLKTLLCIYYDYNYKYIYNKNIFIIKIHKNNLLNTIKLSNNKIYTNGRKFKIFNMYRKIL